MCVVTSSFSRNVQAQPAQMQETAQERTARLELRALLKEIIEDGTPKRVIEEALILKGAIDTYQQLAYRQDSQDDPRLAFFFSEISRHRNLLFSKACKFENLESSSPLIKKQAEKLKRAVKYFFRTKENHFQNRLVSHAKEENFDFNNYYADDALLPLASMPTGGAPSDIYPELPNVNDTPCSSIREFAEKLELLTERQFRCLWDWAVDKLDRPAIDAILKRKSPLPECDLDVLVERVDKTGSFKTILYSLVSGHFFSLSPKAKKTVGKWMENWRNKGRIFPYTALDRQILTPALEENAHELVSACITSGILSQNTLDWVVEHYFEKGLVQKIRKSLDPFIENLPEHVQDWLTVSDFLTKKDHKKTPVAPQRQSRPVSTNKPRQMPAIAEKGGQAASSSKILNKALDYIKVGNWEVFLDFFYTDDFSCLKLVDVGIVLAYIESLSNSNPEVLKIVRDFYDEKLQKELSESWLPS